MSTQNQRDEHVEHHLTYEYQMLGQTISKINEPIDPLTYNAFYESFAVHARNLYAFLKNDGDSRNFRADQFVKDFKLERKQLQVVSGLMDALNEQVLQVFLKNW